MEPFALPFEKVLKRPFYDFIIFAFINTETLPGPGGKAGSRRVPR